MRVVLAGYAKAQSGLGFCYILGLGVEKNPAEAVKWARKGAAQGDTNALVCLAVCYTGGLGVEKNPAEAVKLYLKAAEQGNILGQFCLAGCYSSGLGVESNLTEAAKWYRKAAEQGNANAQVSLANCYNAGLGVETNQVEAVKWCRKAAEQGYAEGEFGFLTRSPNPKWLARCHGVRSFCMTIRTSARISWGISRARNWTARSNSLGVVLYAAFTRIEFAATPFYS